MKDDGLEIEARYSNCLAIGHNAFEFLFEFGQQYEGEDLKIHTRVVASPQIAKGFATLMQRSIEQYEGEHGPIKEAIE